jgi:hypothetical protein
MLLVVIGLVIPLTACFPSKIVINTSQLMMGSSSFTGKTSFAIKAGQSLIFNDPSGNGGTHILVIGKNGAFLQQTGAPTVLDTPNGQQFIPGQTMQITFAQAGTYTITCKIHPTMLATIVVH